MERRAPVPVREGRGAADGRYGGSKPGGGGGWWGGGGGGGWGGRTKFVSYLFRKAWWSGMVLLERGRPFGEVILLSARGSTVLV